MIIKSGDEMPKKTKKTTKKQETAKNASKGPAKDPAKEQEEQMMANLPPDVQERLKEIKKKLEKFQKAALKKFENYIMGIGLLPPSQQGEKVDKEKINVLVLVDDSDSKKMTKQELKEKLSAILQKMAEEIDKKFVIQTVILSEVWQNCYDEKQNS